MSNNNSAFDEWSEKYRPQTLEQIAGHQDTLEAIKNLLANKTLPNLLFYGSPGTGKTTTILAAVRQLFGSENVHHLKLELNASDDRGIDVVRKQIKEFAQCQNLFIDSSLKFIILDEADAMTMDAQSALRVPMEKYAAYVRFGIICNDVSKIHPAIQSRCSMFQFSSLDHAAIVERLKLIADKEQVQFQPSTQIECIEAIVDICGKDLRGCIKFLQKCHLLHSGFVSKIITGINNNNLISPEWIYRSVGKCPKSLLVQFLNNCTQKEQHLTLQQWIQELKTACKNSGCSLTDFVNDFADFLINHISTNNHTATTDQQKTKLFSLASQLCKLQLRLTLDTNEIVQLYSLAATFYTV